MFKTREEWEEKILPHVKISVLHPATLAREQSLRTFQVVLRHLSLNKSLKLTAQVLREEMICVQICVQSNDKDKDTTKGPGVFWPGLTRDVPRVA